METKNENKQIKKSRPLLAVGIVLGTLGLAGLAYWYFVARDEKKADENPSEKEQETPVEAPAPKTKPSTVTSAASSAHSGLPLKKGSKGDLVKQVQKELINHFGASILPKYGADGYFGNEMITALQSKGFKTVIDANEFSKITKGINYAPIDNSQSQNPQSENSQSNNSQSLTPSEIATNIWANVSTKQIEQALLNLKKIKNVSEYSLVSDKLKDMRINGTRYNLVNAMFTFFPSDKPRIETEFLRMGLKKNPSTSVWSLSGISSAPYMQTLRACFVRDNHGYPTQVPAGLDLGEEISTSNGNSYFRAKNNQIYSVLTKNIRYV